MKQRLAQPSDVIDLARIPGMSGVSASADALVIKAATTYFDTSAAQTRRRPFPPSCI
jgi:carbon-monoxide dehydrogenase medium subunit